MVGCSYGWRRKNDNRETCALVPGPSAGGLEADHGFSQTELTPLTVQVWTQQLLGSLFTRTDSDSYAAGGPAGPGPPLFVSMSLVS